MSTRHVFNPDSQCQKNVDVFKPRKTQHFFGKISAESFSDAMGPVGLAKGSMQSSTDVGANAHIRGPQNTLFERPSGGSKGKKMRYNTHSCHSLQELKLGSKIIAEV